MKYAPTPTTPVFVTWSGVSNANHPLRSHPAVTQMVRPVLSSSDNAAAITTKLMAAALDAGVDDTDDVWCVHIQNLTNGQFGGVGPLDAGLDPLVSPTPYTPTPSQCSMFCATGIANTRAKVDAVMALAPAAWNGEGYGRPIIAHDDEQVESYAGVTAPLVGYITGSTPQGVYVPSLNDARSSLETIVPGATLDAVEAARVLAGVSYNDSESYYSTTNLAFSSWFTKYGRLDWLMEQCLYDAVRSDWDAGIVCCNYSCFSADPSNPVLNAFNSNLQERPDQLYADAHSPVLYTPDIDHPSHAARMNLGETNSEYVRRYCKEVRDAIADGPDSEKPVYPWILAPGQSMSYHSYVITEDDVFDIVRYCYEEYGDTRFFVFHGAESETSDDAILRLVERVYEFVGSRYDDNDQGLDPDWDGDTANVIQGIRETADRTGAPFIWMWLPAGSLAPPDESCVTTDSVLPSNVSTYLSNTFSPKKIIGGGGEMERWFVLQGGAMPTSGEQTSQETQPDNDPAYTEADAEFAAESIDKFGSRGFWGGGMSDTADGAAFVESVRLAAQWSNEGWCTPIPLTGSPLVPDSSLITRAPYIVLDSWVEPRDPSGTWSFNKRTTKVVYVLDVPARATTAYVDDIIGRGVIPGVVHGVTPEATQEYIKSRYAVKVPNQGTTAPF